MVTKPKEAKPQMVCANCNEVFTGKKCPECGNTKGNLELSKDGIPKKEHMMTEQFGNASELRPDTVGLPEEILMAQEMARQQSAEMHDNLRESFLIKSKMKKLELEAQLKDKEMEYRPVHVPEPLRSQPEPQQIPQMPQFQQAPMNPQAQFMNQFMKMDVEDRTEFLNQLADADPNALGTLSGFFSQPQPMQQQQMPMNPYGPPPMNPYQQYPPPWMQQQQYEPQQPVKDPTEAAIDMMQKLQDMSERNKHSEPSESVAIITALKEELQAVNERISNMTVEKQNDHNDALMQRLGQIETRVFTPQVDNSFKTQIHSIKEMVDDLQEIGFMQKPESTKTVEEQIRLNEAQHKIKQEERTQVLQEAQLDAQKADKNMKSSLVTGLFKRQLQKNMGPTGEQIQAPIVSNVTALPQNENFQPYTPSPPATIVEEFSSDAGTVRETRLASPEE